MEDVELLRTFLVTKGAYRGIPFEIVHPNEQNNWFCYYVYINLEKIKNKSLAESLWSDYYHEVVNHIYFHSDCSWYSKLYDLQDNRILKIGCDYGHIWDIGKEYTLDDVMTDVKKTIDDFLKKVEYKESV